MSATIKPYVKIVEQPASKAMRFRYECEGRSGSPIFGANSTVENKTYPSIEIVGYVGNAVVIISCVTKDPPYCPHPHKLVGTDCQYGVCKKLFNTEQMPLAFKNLNIRHVKKKNIESVLTEREALRIDPFRTGFNHRLEASAIDLYSLRLCFQVFIDDKKGGFTNPLDPIVSEPIYDKKAMTELEICRVCACPASNIKEPVEVFIQLKRPSDGLLSEPVPFRYLPSISDDEELKRKINSSSSQILRMQELQRQTNQLNISNIQQVSDDVVLHTSTYAPCTSSMDNRSLQPGYVDQHNNPSIVTHLAPDYGFNTNQNLQTPYSYNTLTDNANGCFQPGYECSKTHVDQHNNPSVGTHLAPSYSFNANQNLQKPYSYNTIN
uniref:RHD domain-containing protein n=1 Tax=Glossina austeni TaxID=7395 RepID=A0A1A9VU21_GLOAU